jgi:hypothetical protein
MYGPGIPLRELMGAEIDGRFPKRRTSSERLAVLRLRRVQPLAR